MVPSGINEHEKMRKMRSLAICTYFATYFRLDKNEDSK